MRLNVPECLERSSLTLKIPDLTTVCAHIFETPLSVKLAVIQYLILFRTGGGKCVEEEELRPSSVLVMPIPVGFLTATSPSHPGALATKTKPWERGLDSRSRKRFVQFRKNLFLSSFAAHEDLSPYVGMRD